MLYSFKNREYVEKLEKLGSLQKQVKAVRLQDKLGKQNSHESMKKVFGPVTKAIKDVSEDVTATMMVTSKENNKELENLNKELLEIKNDKSKLATSLMYPSFKITNPENTTQFKLVKVSHSNRVNDLLIQNSIRVTLYDKLLTFRDTGKMFELKGDLLQVTTNNKPNVDFASLSDKKPMYDSAKEMTVDVRAPDNKFLRDRTLIKLLKSPNKMVSASGVSKTRFFHLTLMNYVIEKNYYYMKNRPETVMT